MMKPMNAPFTPLALCACLALAIFAPGAQAAQQDAAHHDHHAHSHDHPHAHGHGDGHAAAVLPIDADHVPWAPDAPLMAGMRRVRDAFDGLQPPVTGGPDETRMPRLAVEVDAAVEYIFENCNLDPEPDVALHGLLARLMAATRALRDDPTDTAPVASMRAVLEDYPRLFDDPAFRDATP